MLSKHYSFSLQVFVMLLSINIVPIITIKYGTQLNTIISDQEGKYDSARVSITIDSITNEVEILMIRKRGSMSSISAQRWLGIGFSADDTYRNNHSNVYAIIANTANYNYFGQVQEYTLAKKNSGSIYTIPEIAVTSDIHSNAGRNVTITRQRIGTFSFPLFPDQLDANNEYKMAVIAALGISADYAHYGHGRSSYSRNIKILTFAPLLNDSWTDETTTIPATLTPTTINPTTSPTITPTTTLPLITVQRHQPHRPKTSTTTSPTITPTTSTTPSPTLTTLHPTTSTPTTTDVPELTTNRPTHSGYHNQSSDIPTDSTTQLPTASESEATNTELWMQINNSKEKISTEFKMIMGVMILVFAVIMCIFGIVWFTIGNNNRKNNDECDGKQKQKNTNVYHSVDTNLDVITSENEQELSNEIIK